MKRTNQISINGTVKGVTSNQLAELLKPFLDSFEYSKNRYKLTLHDDGDNVDVSFNDPSDFTISFQGQKFDKDGFLVHAMNAKYNTDAIPILKSIIDFLNSKEVVYNIEVQYEYDNGEWRDEDFFVHPNFKWE